MTLIAAFLSIMLLLGLGGALILTTMVETQAAAAFDRGAEAFHAAEGAVEYAVQELASVADWTEVTSGAIRSPLADGAPTGSRSLDDGTTVHLGALAGMWTPYLYSRLERLHDARINSTFYVVVWVCPSASGGILLQGHAYGPGGARRMIEVTVERDLYGHVRQRSWRELRQ